MIMTSSLSHDDLADRVKTAGNPILLLDTCTVLDIIRAPASTKKIQLDHIKAIRTVLDHATEPTPKVSLVITQKVVEEFNNKKSNNKSNVEKVENDSRKDIKEILDNGILSRMDILTSSQTLPQTNDCLSYQFSKSARDIAEKVIQESSVLNDNVDTVMTRADCRESDKRPPAKL